MTGKRLLKVYRHGDIELSVLEGEEIMLEVDATSLTTIDELHELAEWLENKSIEISTKFATGEFA